MERSDMRISCGGSDSERRISGRTNDSESARNRATNDSEERAKLQVSESELAQQNWSEYHERSFSELAFNSEKEIN